MRRPLSARILAASLLLGTASFALSNTPAAAQGEMSVSFRTFHEQLAPYGDWVYSDRWGEVWIPDVSASFHPYDTRGHWAYTDEYGWLWVSDYEWGDIAFHYGRWVNDPDDGWLWIPGYVWSPGWVVWRSNGQYTGWMPMPPDENFLNGSNSSVGISVGGGGLGFSINFNDTNDYYGYSRWYGRDYDENRFASNWVFIGTRHMADRDFHRYEAPRSNYTTIVRNTTNITNYTVVNNYVVNRSVDVHTVERARGRSIAPVHADTVMRRPQFVLRVDMGRDIEMRARAERPRGNGDMNSAPRPPQQVIDTLSTKLKAHGGRPPAHLFTRDTVKTAPLPEKPAGTPPSGAGNPATPPEHNGRGPRDNSGNPTGTPGNGAANPATGTPPERNGRGPRDNSTNPLTGMPNNGAANPATATPPEHKGRGPRDNSTNPLTGAPNNGAATPPTGTPPDHTGRGNSANPVTGMPSGNPAEPNNGTTTRDRMRQHGNENLPATEANPQPGAPAGIPSETNHGATVRDRMRQHGNENVPAGTATPPVLPETNKLVPAERIKKPEPSTDHGAGDMSPMHPPVSTPSTSEPAPGRNRHPDTIIPPPVTPPDNSNAGRHMEQMPQNVETPRVPREPRAPAMKAVEPAPTPPAVKAAPTPPAVKAVAPPVKATEPAPTPDARRGRHEKKPKSDEPGAPPQ